MRPAVLAAGFSVVLSELACSQPVYRCGNTYSAAPCTTPTAPIVVSRDAAPSATGIVGRQLCATAMARQLGHSDAESAGIVSVARAPTEVIQYKGAPLVARRYIVNARGRLYTCHLSEDERRILSVDAPSVQAQVPGQGAGAIGGDPRAERDEAMRQSAEKKRDTEERARLAEERASLRRRLGLPP